MNTGKASSSDYAVLLLPLVVAACVSFTGCAGPVILKEARPLESSKPVAEAKDERILASIETIIFRNGAGAWASDADWDEYLIRIHAQSDEPVEIREIAIFDALDHRVESRTSRGELADGSREIERRYEESGQLVRTSDVNGWAVVGIGMTGAGGISIIAALPGGFASASTAAAGAAGAVVILGAGVVAAGAGVMRLVNNAEVNNEIKRRQTTLPVMVQRGSPVVVDLFYPLTPLSRSARIVYGDRNGEHRLDIHMRQEPIDINPPPVLLFSGNEPIFPRAARAARVSEGHVIAKLSLDSQGKVKGVSVTESVPPGVFDDAARRAFFKWIYTKSLHDTRTVEARLDFKF